MTTHTRYELASAKLQDHLNETARSEGFPHNAYYQLGHLKALLLMTLRDDYLAKKDRTIEELRAIINAET